MIQKILVLEDEENIRGFVVINLKRAGYNVIEAETGEQALNLIAAHPDIRLALLDIMLPGEPDGLEVCRRLRALKPGVGIIMLTARTQELDKVTGLVSGADDYITKPFSPTELIARVDALSRRLGGAAAEPAEAGATLVSGPFLLNARNRTLQKNGTRVKLTQVEFAIMKLFMENPDIALSREKILRMAWGDESFGDLKIVDVNIRRLRIKIEDDTANPVFITTVWGYGYKWGA
jgi:DNA-binding response OmpR family regulator